MVLTGILLLIILQQREDFFVMPFPPTAVFECIMIYI